MAYYRLYEEVAVDVMYMLEPETSMYKDRYKSLNLGNKELVYEFVNKNWISRRAANEKSRIIKWNIPKEVKDAIELIKSSCSY